MFKFTYYWLNDDGQAHKAGSDENYGRWRNYMPQVLRQAKKVWAQGPSGGTQLIRYNWWLEEDGTAESIGYITNHPQAMAEFSWVVLAAKPLNIRI